MSGGFIEINHIKSDKRNKQVKDTVKKIGNGAGKIFKAIGNGIFKITKDIQESQKPENQLKRLKTKKELLSAKAEVMKEQGKIDKLRPKGTSTMGGLGGFIDNANKNMQEVFGTNMFNDKKNKNNGGLFFLVA